MNSLLRRLGRVSIIFAKYKNGNIRRKNSFIAKK